MKKKGPENRRLMYITDFYPYSRIKNGGETVSQNNLGMLQTIFDGDVHVYSMKRRVSLINKLIKLYYSFRGFYWPLTPSCVNFILQFIKINNITDVFLDGSRYGLIVREIKNVKPEINVFCFFHNIETHYLATRDSSGFIRKGILNSVRNAEIYALEYSNACAFISNRDLQFVNSSPTNVMVIPVSIVDRYNNEYKLDVPKEQFILFFGSAFFANVEGVRWFKENVMPFVSIPLFIVGKGFEQYESELTTNNITVIGSVDNPEWYFYHSLCVVAPIFSGSGMKVKTAEAMMYGKKILGSDESFVGYDSQNSNLVICNEAAQYISCINDLKEEDVFCKDVREEYLQNFTIDSVLSNFKKFVSKS